MSVSPIYIMGFSVPFTAILTAVILRRRPNGSNRRIVRLAAIPSTFVLLVVLIGSGSFAGDPNDWEGLTHVFAPIACLILVGQQFLIGLGISALLLRQLRPDRGYIE